MNVFRLITDFIKMSKVWFLSMEFYGVWQEVADLGYLGFQDYHKKFSALFLFFILFMLFMYIRIMYIGYIVFGGVSTPFSCPSSSQSRSE